MIACEGDDVVCSLVQDEQCELMHNVLFFLSAAGFLLMIKKKKEAICCMQYHVLH